MSAEDILPPKSETVNAIYAAWKAKGDAEESRGYLGASIIGHACERYLWYCFRQATKEDIGGRIYRLFNTGDIEEARIVEDLRMIGCTVHEVDPNTGQQFEISEFGGHFSGHTDGALVGLPEAPKTWHLLEAKSHNNKSFVALEKKGVKKSKPQHYSQMQAYMGKQGLKRALYFAVNKDTDELYCERVHFDQAHYDLLMEKARRIITQNQIPPRLSDRPDYYQCGWCDAKEICHATSSEAEACATSGTSCRQCCFATPDIAGEGARWTCDKLGKALSVEDQDRACERLLYLPGIVDAHSEPVNYGQDENGVDYIDYQVREPDSSGRPEWRQGGGAGWSASELRFVSVSTLSNPLVERAREQGADVVHHEARGNCIERYSDMDTCWCSWNGAASDTGVGFKQLYGYDMSALEPLDQDENLNVIGIEFQVPDGPKVCVVVDTGCMKSFIMEEKH